MKKIRTRAPHPNPGIEFTYADSRGYIGPGGMRIPNDYIQSHPDLFEEVVERTVIIETILTCPGAIHVDKTKLDENESALTIIFTGPAPDPEAVKAAVEGEVITPKDVEAFIVWAVMEMPANWLICEDGFSQPDGEGGTEALGFSDVWKKWKEARNA